MVRKPAQGACHAFVRIRYSRRHIALSRDGKIAVLGSWNQNSAELGPIYPPYTTAPTASGGVAVYEHKANGWTLRRLVKPASTNEQWAGHAVALGHIKLANR